MTAALVLLLAVGGPEAATRQASADADAVASRLQAHYETIRDFSAEFVHTYEGGVLRRQVSERGVVLVKKPGMMRWTYQEPEEKLFVSDGEHMYSYVPADEQVMVTRLPDDDVASTPILFLVGRGNLVRDFEAAIDRDVQIDQGEVALRLTPRAPSAEYDSLTLVVDRETMALRQLITRDAQGGRSTFVFTNLDENVGAADSEFTFTPPRGTDVITES